MARGYSLKIRSGARVRKARCARLDEALPFAEFARSTSYQVRFIEFMPLDGDHAWSSDQVLPGEELRAIIHRVHPLEEVVRAAVWRKELKHRVNEPGFVAPERTMSAIGG